MRAESVWKGTMTGFAGGLVGWWAVNRFYRMARASSSRHALVPYCIGAGAGAAYGALVLSRKKAPRIARVPLSAAVYLARPEETAHAKGGRTLADKAGNLTLRLVSRGLKKAAETALFA